jgi:DNA-directed RNA polymerase specialized sigma24 family protein
VSTFGREAASRFVDSNMTPDDFEELILWLDPDPAGTGVPNPERGAEKYEKIRHRIIKIYTDRGYHRAEEVADETMERVGIKVKKLRLTYEGDPALYFYGVAKRVYHEFLRDEKHTITAPLPVDDPDEVERRHAWLEHCLDELKSESRELILCFYYGEKRKKIDNRKALAARLGITSRALSLRALHIRQRLLQCMQGYLSGQGIPK